MWAIISMCYKRRGMFMHPLLRVEYRLAASRWRGIRNVYAPDLGGRVSAEARDVHAPDFDGRVSPCGE